MKSKTKISLLFFLTFVSLINAQVTYVNSGASGLNDGSTWENAYSSLGVALANTTSGDIWIASGTYNHEAAEPDTLNTFFVTAAINLYGGFAGTESSLDERVAGENESVLSGDFNGDDVEGDFEMNKSDNAFHVVTVDSLLSEPVVFDGITFTGGHTGTNTDDVDYVRRGGGIFSYSTIEINNCKFTGNFANSGAGIYITPAAGGGSGSKLTNSTFTMNRSNARGTGIYFFRLENIKIENNEFSNNQVARGCIYPFASNNVTIRNNTFTENEGAFAEIFTTGIFIYLGTHNLIENCTFSNSTASNATGIYFEGDGVPADSNLTLSMCTFSGNTATDWGGADLYFWQATGVLIDHCTFADARGPNGAVMYHDGRDTPLDPSNVTFRNCTFKNNEASSFGGGTLYSWQGGLLIDSCIFDGNKGPNAGAFYIDNREKEGLGLIVKNSAFSNQVASDFGGGAIRANQVSLQIESSSFDNNSCNNGAAIFMFSEGRDMDIKDCTFTGNSGDFGGALNCYGLESDYNLENLTFSENQATTSGGSIIIGFGANARVTNCDFQNGFAESGAAIRVQNDQTLLEVIDSRFEMNEADGSGGAIFMSQGSNVEINSCDFTGNNANSGGAISTFESLADTVESHLEIINSKFGFNAANQQGGAINVIDTDTRITNSLINNNFNLNGISGAGLSGNASDSSGLVTIDIVNTTIAGNEGEVGHGIGLYTGETESELTLTLRNTILANEGTNYEIEAGNPVVVSEGGNVVSDESLASVLIGVQDKNNEQGQLFVSYDDFDYHLSASSIAINIGQGSVPEFDLDGLPRVNAPDAGAYEYQLDVSIEEIIVGKLDDLSIHPNPVQDQLNISLKNEWKGSIGIRLYNINGQLLSSWTVNKTSEKSTHSFVVDGLESGAYNIIVDDGKNAISAKLVKVD